MKARTLLFALLALLFSAALLFAAAPTEEAENTLPQPDFKRIDGSLPDDVYEAVSRIPEQPHFLRGFKRLDDEWEQFLAIRRFFKTDNLMNSGSQKPFIDKSAQGYARPSGVTELSDTLEIDGKKLPVLYTDYHGTGDGMHAFWSKNAGAVNLAKFSPLYRKYEIRWGVGNLTDSQWKDVQRMLGWAQFQAVHSFVKDMIREGLEKNVRDYGAMQLVSGIVSNRAAWLDDDAYGDRANMPMPNTGGLLVGDFLPVPCVQTRCFLPDAIVISATWAGGMVNAWQLPGTETIAFLGLRGLAVQYISHWPLASHEFVHANSHLQGLPLSYYFDVEMWAALTTDLTGGGMLEYLQHPYLSVIRDSAHTYFGYDAEEAQKRIFPEGFSVYDVREEEFRAHAQKIARTRNELVDFITSPDDGLMVQFYSDPFFWQAINTEFCDTAAVWRILLSLRYEPAGIYNPEKVGETGEPIPPAVQTKRWLAKEIEAGRIKKLAEESLKQTGEPSDFAKEAEEMGKAEDLTGFSKCPVHSRFFYMDAQERRAFKVLANKLLERARSGDTIARARLMRIFAGSGALSALDGIW